MKCLNTHNRSEMVPKAIECFDSRCRFSINLLDSMLYLKGAWSRTKNTTMRNCFCQERFKERSEKIVKGQDEVTTDSVV